MPSAAALAWAPLDDQDFWRPGVCLWPESPLVGDWIPRSSWGLSLARIATASSWKSLLEARRLATSGRCELCGDLQERLELHEVWRFLDDRQELSDIYALCRSCHQTQHMGLAQAQGNLLWVFRQLRRLWGFPPADAEDLYEQLRLRWERHSLTHWKVVVHPAWLDHIKLRRGYRLDVDYCLQRMA